MKTQINNLVTGNHIQGICGTSKVVRNEIAEKVISENPESITIELRGVKLTLKANWSKSRLSVSYFGTMPIDLYKSMFGEFCLPKHEPKSFIQLNGDMTVFASTSSKKPAYQKIKESEIIIK